MFKNQNISGVAGWLALLIVALAILGPLQGYGSLINEFDRAIDQYPQLASNVLMWTPPSRQKNIEFKL